jgi:hypothetical protein
MPGCSKLAGCIGNTELYESNKAAVCKAKQSMKVAMDMVALAAAENKYRFVEDI